MKIAMFGQKRIPTREGGVEIVVEELSTAMAARGHQVTCYNRGGHHVSGIEFDRKTDRNWRSMTLKTVPTLDKICLYDNYRHRAACDLGESEEIHGDS